MITKAQELLDQLLQHKENDPAFDQKEIVIKFTAETSDSVRGHVSVGDEFYPEGIINSYPNGQIIISI